MIRPDQLFNLESKSFVPARNNPYVRALGFLFIRICSPPEQLWPRLHLFLLEEEFEFVAGNDVKTTIGTYIEGLLSDTNYYNTILPRTPVLI